jgi:hypothetical protein
MVRKKLVAALIVALGFVLGGDRAFAGAALLGRGGDTEVYSIQEAFGAYLYAFKLFLYLGALVLIPLGVLTAGVWLIWRAVRGPRRF